MIAALGGAACVSPSPDSSDEGGGAIEATTCESPGDVGAPGAEDTGCQALPTFQICDDSTGTCHDACAPSEYPLECTGAPPTGPIPPPDPSMGCTVIPIPTPSNALYYCCPCAS